MAGHVAVKIFLGEYWTGATGDFEQIRFNLWSLAHYGYFGPPITLDGTLGVSGNFGDKAKLVEKYWQQLEDQTEQVLRERSAEVHAVAAALLEREDLTGRECVEIIRAVSGEPNKSIDPNTEKVLSALVDEVTGKKEIE